MAIECKWSAGDFDPANLLVFARAHPKATWLVTAPDARPSFTRDPGDGNDGAPVSPLRVVGVVRG